jgi:hypothetical protein
MMIDARLALLVLSPLLLLGATCITSVEQKGPEGPWVGEVTNTGPDPVGNVIVLGSILDTNGKLAGGGVSRTCPGDLLPGEKGYFMLRAVPPETLSDPARGLVLPAVLTDLQVFTDPWLPVSGLTFRAVETYKEHKAVLVEMRNDSSTTYHGVDVCAVLFSADGEVQEKVFTRPILTSTVRPGDVRVFPIQFSSPIEGPILFGVDSAYGPARDRVLDPSLLHISAYRIVQTEGGRELQAVGEVLNNTGVNLSFAVYQVYLTTSPTVRATRFVGPASMGVAGERPDFSNGNGFIVAGGKASVAFVLPLDDADSTQIEVAGIEADTSESEVWLIPVRNISKQRLAADALKVSATLYNPTGEYMMVRSLCFNLRGNHDELVGTSCRGFPDGIEARGSLVVSAEVTEIGPARSVEVIAYGSPGWPITPPR